MIGGMYNAGLGKAGKYYKNILGRLGSGEDVSGLPFYQQLAQTHANQRQAIDEENMTGGNALIGQSGGEDALVLNRMHQYQADQQRAREGGDYAAAGAQLSQVAGQGYQNALNTQVGSQEAALGGELGYYGKRNVPYGTQSGWDKFMQIANMGAGAASALI